MADIPSFNPALKFLTNNATRSICTYTYDVRELQTPSKIQYCAKLPLHLDIGLISAVASGFQLPQ